MMRVLLVEDSQRLAALLAEGLRRAGWQADCVTLLSEAAAAIEVGSMTWWWWIAACRTGTGWILSAGCATARPHRRCW